MTELDFNIRKTNSYLSVQLLPFLVTGFTHSPFIMLIIKYQLDATSFISISSWKKENCIINETMLKIHAFLDFNSNN